MKYRLDIGQSRRDNQRDPSADLISVLENMEKSRADKEQLDIENKRKDAAALEYKRQNDLNETRLGNQERRTQREFEMKGADRNKATFDTARKAYLEGGESEAEAATAAADYVDPETGERRGLRFNRSGKVPDFKAPLQLQDPTAEPQISPAARGAATMFGKLKVGDDVSRGAAAGAARADLTEGVDTNNADRANVDRPSISMPNGEKVFLDPGERDRFKAKGAQEQKDRLMAMLSDPTLPPDIKRSIALRAGLTGAQATGAEGAQIMGRDAQDDGQAHTVGENAKYKLTTDQQLALEREKIAARAKRGGPKAIDPVKKKRSDDMDAAAADLSFSRFATMNGVKDALARAQKYTEMADQLGAGSPALDTVVAGTWVKMAQGGTGVISDQDMKAFWSNMGSIGLKGEEMVHAALEGKLGDAKRALVLQAVGKMKAGTEKQLSRLAGQAESYMKQSPHAASWGRTRAGYFPWYKDQLDENGQPAVKAPGQREISPTDQAMVDKAKARLAANPNDAVAKEVLRRNGIK